jgi:hypothetical protein
MPSRSDKQRKMMAIAEHEPDKLHDENKGVLSMSQTQLSEFATKPKHMKYHGEGRKAHGS